MISTIQYYCTVIRPRSSLGVAKADTGGRLMNKYMINYLEIEVAKYHVQ